MALPKVEGYAIVEKIGAGSYASVYKAFKKIHSLRRCIALHMKQRKQETTQRRFCKETHGIYGSPVNRLKNTRQEMRPKTAHLIVSTDFGFAQYLSPEDYNSSLRGSPLYMAPEMLLKRHYDASVDLWSVGVIMYECLFGRAPYSSSNFKELAEKIKSEMPIEVPHGGCISDDCRDLLVRLLKHNPSERIDYESFFNHPFLDLEHMPSPESYQKAVELVQNAVKCDAEQKFNEAFDLYCESLRYFVPLVNDEDDTKKKIAFRNKVNEYIRRAEDLKTLLYEKENNCKHPKGQHTTDGTLEELMRLCATNSTMQTALEIGASAEQYLKEGQYSHALEKFQSCLGLLVPLLSSEPKGRRRDLLHTQVQQWLTQAENIKSFLNLISITDDTAALSKEACSIQ
ncbi:serine/threonine-protein kinase ULK3 [Schistocerca piceifrons]|uniref:serine/threonine-protein kinase ULK3 n=1 Tax=Schistocerca piceifrons TaxID=274613 RepID=UPI001F5FD49A|nr:serine/threonine-protein kinase ULK3 [Schistocerca piceifrons]